MCKGVKLQASAVPTTHYDKQNYTGEGNVQVGLGRG